MFLFGVAVTVAAREAVSRVLEEDQERRRPSRPVSFEEQLAEKRAWEGKPMTRAERKRTMEVFLGTFAQTGNLMLSCRAANIGRSAIYDYLERDVDGFASRYTDAGQEACEALAARNN